MVDVKSKKCERSGCNKRPTFNFDGERTGRFCAQHKLDGMVNVTDKKCEQSGCDTRSYFQHMLEEMADVHTAKRARLAKQREVEPHTAKRVRLAKQREVEQDIEVRLPRHPRTCVDRDSRSVHVWI